MKENKEITDEDLRRVVPMAWDQIDATIPPKEEINLELSRDFQQRMEETLSRRGEKKKKIKIRRWMAVAGIVLCLLAVAIPFSVKANRLKILAKGFGDRIQLIFISNDKTDEETSPASLKVPNYIPKGFSRQLNEVEDTSIRQTYYDDEGHLIYYHTEYFHASKEQGTKSAPIHSEKIEGQEVFEWESDDKYHLSWQTQEQGFELIADSKGITREELIRMATSIIRNDQEKR